MSLSIKAAPRWIIASVFIVNAIVTTIVLFGLSMIDALTWTGGHFAGVYALAFCPVWAIAVRRTS